jgi:hypothetical protein
VSRIPDIFCKEKKDVKYKRCHTISSNNIPQRNILSVALKYSKCPLNYGTMSFQAPVSYPDKSTTQQTFGDQQYQSPKPRKNAVIYSLHIKILF